MKEHMVKLIPQPEHGNGLKEVNKDDIVKILNKKR